MEEAEVLALVNLLTALAPLIPVVIQQIERGLHPSQQSDLQALHASVNEGFAKVLAS